MYDRKTKEFTTLDGTKIKLKRIRPFKIQILSTQIRDKYVENGEPLEPPFYFVPLATGKQQRHYHSEKTIYQQGDEKIYLEGLDQETVDAWEAHVDAVSRLEEEVALSNMFLIIQDGTDFEVQDGDWIEDQKLQGFEVPENKKARKAHYLITEVLELEETKEIAQLIMKISNLQMEAQIKEADSIGESFRDQMEES